MQPTQLVHNALSHLYDSAYLESHPLAEQSGSGLDGVTRAQKLRRLLLDCIELLKPQTPGAPHSDATRAYAILTYRYVDDLSVEEICSKLAISRRQFYREHRKGINAVAHLLMDGAHSETHQEIERLRRAKHVEPIAIHRLLDETLALLSPVLGQHNRRAVVEAETNPIALADRVMLRQALLNLLNPLSNADGGELRIALTQAHGRAHIRIHEPVIDAAGRFARLSDDYSIARALIAEQSGDLSIDNRPDGLHIDAWLPAVDQAAILVVDDNADLVALFQRYLGGYPVSVIGATNGEDALRLAGELKPSVITLDVMMPKQDGWDILQQLKRASETCSIPIVVCSVLHEMELAMSMGASGYLAKPVTQTAFLEVLRRWLGAPKQAE